MQGGGGTGTGQGGRGHGLAQPAVQGPGETGDQGVPGPGEASAGEEGAYDEPALRPAQREVVGGRLRVLRVRRPVPPEPRDAGEGVGAVQQAGEVARIGAPGA
ncbi:hypothetical protein SHKM778_26720 [Streptomyces sp. KM77-8]|uniref:Uncharacterized protein n=1 Tax=Streptomyces haneummycinicus TaxID=3074435 RepID=A0AAT9HFT5_9ACTN